MARRSRRFPPGVVAPDSAVPRGAVPTAPAWAILLLVAVAAVAFANSLAGQFVFDDDEAIVGNPYIRALWPLNSALSAPSQSAVSGRPLVSLSLALNYALGGLDPTGYHLWNIAVHLGVAFLLYGVLRRTFWSADFGADRLRSSSGLAIACALLWLVHPLNSEVCA